MLLTSPVTLPFYLASRRRYIVMQYNSTASEEHSLCFHGHGHDCKSKSGDLFLVFRFHNGGANNVFSFAMNMLGTHKPQLSCNHKNISCQSQLAEEQHEQFFLLNIGFLNLQCYFGEAICTGLFRTDFLHGFLHGFSARISARIFCTDFLHGFFARIFCTDFFARFFARFFCADFCADCLQELFVQMLHGFLHGFFRGVPKHLLGSAKISPRESPGKFTMLWGPWGGAREAGG